ncbi:probable G-protein coupled receptor [Sinocyclocheilus grahami]|uniref:probable G-protein coupled receptor n=1 Tax=Sinocyclocheilus grahami TaxID=75366 RepID=UPI0007ACFB39|nr:PREDICTED: probable G-protein coupled receptor [Sinocyclocheilus grahami]
MAHFVGSFSLHKLHYAAHCSLHWSHSRLRKVFAILFSVLCFLVPSVVIFAVYCNVYKVARTAARQHAPMPTWTANQAKRRSDSINSQTTIITTTRSLPQRLSPERVFGGGKAAITLVVIVGQFLICWLPYFSFHLHMSITTPLQSPGDIEEAVTWLAYSSFAVNPFFYGLLNRQIREELIKLRKCCARRPVELRASSHEGSIQENFLQFLQRTSSTAETTRPNCGNSSPRITVNQGARLPGQILEE